MSRFALRLAGVRKRYGKTVALDGLTLDVPRGSVMGLVGPNGAGKTTTFGIVSGAVRPDAGTVDVLGTGPFDPDRHAGRVTVLPQDCELNPHSSCQEILTFYARLQGLRDPAREAKRVLEVVRLTDRARSRVRQLSHGMKRRLAVAQALLGDPELVLLDEPTGGLDPHLVVEMRDVLREQRGARTLVVSSHILSDLEATCDHVAFIEAGRVTKSGPTDELMGRAGLVSVRLAAPVALEAVAEVLEGRAPRVEGEWLTYALLEGEDAPDAHAALIPKLVAAGARVVELRLGRSLEAAYLESRARELASELSSSG